MLMQQHWWAGMQEDVKAEVKRCEVCDRVSRASFGAMQPTLHPLPIEGLFYRWGVDLCGPFTTTTAGNKYVMVCIEHFSKWVELVPITNKEAATTAQAFFQDGGCAEVLTDRGSEFQGDFQEMLLDAFVDHRTTSPNHPRRMD